MSARDDYGEELSLQGGMPVRPQSPVLEVESRKIIESAVRELLERKSLYQKVEVDLVGVRASLLSLESAFLVGYELEKQQKGMTAAKWTVFNASGKAD